MSVSRFANSVILNNFTEKYKHVHICSWEISQPVPETVYSLYNSVQYGKD